MTVTSASGVHEPANLPEVVALTTVNQLEVRFNELAKDVHESTKKTSALLYQAAQTLTRLRERIHQLEKKVADAPAPPPAFDPSEIMTLLATATADIGRLKSRANNRAIQEVAVLLETLTDAQTDFVEYDDGFTAVAARRIRERAGISQRELAAMVGINQRTMGDWERGRLNAKGDNKRRWRAVIEQIQDDYTSEADTGRGG